VSQRPWPVRLAGRPARAGLPDLPHPGRSRAGAEGWAAGRRAGPKPADLWTRGSGVAWLPGARAGSVGAVAGWSCWIMRPGSLSPGSGCEDGCSARPTWSPGLACGAIVAAPAPRR